MQSSRKTAKLMIYCGIYIREGVSRDVLDQLADSTAEVLRPGADAATMVPDNFVPSVKPVRAKNSAT
jgi:hypothetical protein